MMVPILNTLWLNGLLAISQPGPIDLPLVVKLSAIPAQPQTAGIHPVAFQDPPTDEGGADPLSLGQEDKEEQNEVPAEEELLLRRLLDTTALGRVLNDNGIVFRGLTNGNFTASTAPRVNLPMGWNYLGNQFLLEQNTLIMEKAIDTSSDQFNWGARIYAILPGTDYVYTTMNNLGSSQLTMNDGRPNTYGVDVPEFYLNGYIPEWKTDVKVGRFYTILFNESIDPTLNRLVSRAMSFIYNPFTHVGALATTRLADNWTLTNGITAGNDVFFGPSSAPFYLGGLRWDSTDKNTTLAFNTTLGDARFNQFLETANLYDVFELYFSKNLSERLNYTLDIMYSLINQVEGDFYSRDGVGPRHYQGNATWYGFVNYFTYTFTDDFAGTFRFEAFDDNKGVRTGYEGLYTNYSLGAVYRWREGIWLRPELRYDYNGTSRAFEGNHGLFTAAADFILRW